MNQSVTVDFSEVLTIVSATVGWPSLCSIYQPTESLDALGQPNLDPASAAPVVGLQNIECRKAVLLDAKPAPQYEVRDQQYIAQMNEFHILLNGYYPTIEQSQIALIGDNNAGVLTDGEFLNIRNVERDSQRIMTRLECERFRY